MILFIEDESIEQCFIETAAKRVDGMPEIQMVQNPTVALRWLAETPIRPTLIITDLNMPQMDGIDVVGALAADPELSSIPVLVWSTGFSQEWQEKLAGSAARGVFYKPDTLQSLIAFLASLTRFIDAGCPKLPLDLKRQIAA
ncbi:MAG: response regulator [Myxococcota bacterium]